MLLQLLEITIYIMALYGIIILISSFMRNIWNKMEDTDRKEENIKLVLVVKDQEEVIEGIIRSFYMGKAFENKFARPWQWQWCPCNRIIDGKGITVIDTGSEDKTIEILKKLKHTYNSLEVLTINEKDKIFEDINVQNIM